MLAPTRAERLRALLFLALGGALVVAVLAIVLGLPMREKTVGYVLRFDSTVLGLEKGSEVRYKGVRVGEVLNIEISPASPDRILVDFEVKDGTPIYRSGTRAKISAASIVGPFIVELENRDEKGGLAPPGWVIQAEPSQMMRILEAGTALGEELPRIVENLQALTGEGMRTRVIELTDATTAAARRLPGTLDRLDGALRSWQRVGDEVGLLLAGPESQVPGILRDVSATARRLRTLAESGELERTLRTLQDTLVHAERELSATSEALRAFVRNDPISPQLARAVQSLERTGGVLRGTIARTETEGVGFLRSELVPLVSSLRTSAEELARVAALLRADPSLLLFAGRAEEVPMPAGGEKR